MRNKRTMLVTALAAVLVVPMLGCFGPDPDDPSPSERRTAAPVASASESDSKFVNVGAPMADSALFSGNQAGRVDYTATSEYIMFAVQRADEMWEAWFKQVGLQEPWVGVNIIMPGQTYTTKCKTETGEQTFGSDYPNAFYCPADMNQSDRGVLVYPVQTMAKMWTGDMFGQQVDNTKNVGDFAAAMITFHEFGHSVQDELLENYERKGVQPPQQPNSELLADCFSGIAAHSVRVTKLLEEGDLEEAINALGVIGDNVGSHGTGEQRQDAFLTGLNGTQDNPVPALPGNCVKKFWPELDAVWQ